MRFAQWLQGEASFVRLRELNHSQWLSPDELRARQWVATRATLEHAWEKIPFYRELWQGAGICLEDLRGWEDFARLPVLEKQMVRDHQQELVVASLQADARRGETSGSTGEPLRFWHNKEFGSRHEAGQWRARQWFGVQPGDATFAVWGRPISPAENRMLQFKSLLNNIIHVSAFDLSEAYMEKLLPRLRRFRPRHVYGYPSGIYEVARYAEEQGFRLDNLGVRLVSCTSENLYGFQRELLQRVFAAPVANVYGCGEFGAFAHQCPSGCMHIAVENVVVEFVEGQQPVPPGQSGEVVVTNLYNEVMPLIRYRVGDIGVPLAEPCRCGRGLAVMDMRAGKIGQMVKVASGRMFSTELFDYINRQLMDHDLKGIRHFLVIQEQLDAFTVQVVQGPGDLAQASELFEKSMREIVGPEASIRFALVDQIARNANGKLGYFESRLGGPPPA